MLWTRPGEREVESLRLSVDTSSRTLQDGGESKLCPSDLGLGFHSAEGAFTS